jgi:hypothetical protein
MTPNQYIPAGRTSLIYRSGSPLQVQTEYAFRPYPRVTTTILDNGKVLHKVERKLNKGIESIEEQSHMEEVIKAQHSEILAVINEKNETKEEKEARQGQVKITATQKFSLPSEPTLADKFGSIPGVEKVYQLDRAGRFLAESESSFFKNAYPAIFQGLEDLIQLFMQLPGAEMKRERGVCEVDRDRLYFVSAGKEFYFLIVTRIDHKTEFEKEIKKIVCPSPFDRPSA